MAIADQTTAAALVRQFADLLAGEPAVERIWYLAEPPHAPWSSVYLTFWVQLSDLDDDLKRRVDDATMRTLGDHKLELGIYLFLLDAILDRNLEEVMDPETAIEIPLRKP